MSTATRIRMLAVALALLAIAPGAQASSTWYGAQLSAPLPVRDAGNSEFGYDVGVTATEFHRAHVGTGLDFAYHYWPVSSEFKAGYDRLLRNRFNRVIDGSKWAFSAYQASGHVKLVAPPGGRYTPWIQAGFGFYGVDSRVTGLRDTGVTFDPGWYGGAGFDFATGSGTAIGLHVTFHHVWMEDHFGSDFTAFTAGTHVLFGR